MRGGRRAQLVQDEGGKTGKREEMVSSRRRFCWMSLRIRRASAAALKPCASRGGGREEVDPVSLPALVSLRAFCRSSASGSFARAVLFSSPSTFCTRQLSCSCRCSSELDELTKRSHPSLLLHRPPPPDYLATTSFAGPSSLRSAVTRSHQDQLGAIHSSRHQERHRFGLQGGALRREGGTGDKGRLPCRCSGLYPP